ncbi:hypothetical protein ACFWUQ_22495 [Streptomyces sp. NPDC058662]|uniref:hypothetical protein n=1 Tax=Streptomyces sp. NPDC058662 TaxID=3346583 RepID=UPI0036545FDE
MTDSRRTSRRISLGSLLRPAALGPRVVTRALAAVTRGARRRRAAAGRAVCPTAAQHRSGTGRVSGAGSPLTGRLPCREAPAGPAERRDQAHEAVVSHTRGPDDLASLLAMLDLRPGPRGDDGGHDRA